MRSESSFNLFWQVIVVKAQKLSIGKPALPRKQKIPKLGQEKLSFMLVLKITTELFITKL